MALALDASTPAIKTADDANAILTSDSFTPPAGSRVWALAAWDAANAATIEFSSTPTLTWTPVYTNNACNGIGACAYADIASSASMTVTATITSGNHFAGRALHCMVVTGGNNATPYGDVVIETNPETEDTTEVVEPCAVSADPTFAEFKHTTPIALIAVPIVIGIIVQAVS